MDGMLPDFQLVEAVKSGSRENVDLAISRGATLDARDLGGNSLLRLAEKCHQNDIARYLIQLGASVHVVVSRNGRSLLHLATNKQNFGFATVLVEAGLSPNVEDFRGLTPLHIATKNCHQYFVRYLLEHGADPNRVACSGDTPLHLAARAGNIQIIQELIRKGALSQQNNKHRTPFQEALKFNRFDAADLLRYVPDLTSEAKSTISPDNADMPKSAEWAAESKGRRFSAQVRQSSDSDNSRSR